MTTRVCRRCGEEKPLEKFVVQKNYRIWQCNSCRFMSAQSRRDRERNRAVSRLINWRAS